MHKKVLHIYCPDCRGDRMHGFRPADQPDGRVIRARYCTACERETALPPEESPGVCCRKCGDVRLQVYQTRHSAPGVTVRIKRCRYCKRRTSRVTEFDSIALAELKRTLTV